MKKIRIPKITKLENIFVLLILIMGLLFAFLVPPNQVPDEGAHFMSVYRMLEGNSTNKIPETLLELLANGFNTKISDAPGNKIFINSYIQEFAHQNDRTRMAEFNAATNYSPILYLPQLIAVAVAKALRLNNLWLFVSGRLVSVIVYICVGYWVLKTTPVAKRTLFVILTLPMVVFLAASYSADTVQIEITFIYLNCLMLGIGTQALFSKKDWTIFSVLAILLSFTKPVSLVILLTPLAIPVSRFGNSKKKKLVFVAAHIGMGVIVAAMWNIWGASSLGGSYGSNIWPLKQLAFIILNPLTFLKIVRQTFIIHGDFYFQSLTGVFGYLIFGLPDYARFLILISFFTAVFSEPKKVLSFSKEQKTLFALVFGLYVLGLEVIMYLVWTPFKDDIINGVQGRYFIPIIPLLLYIIVGLFKNTLPFKQVWLFFIATLASIVLAISVHLIYLIYYVPCGENYYKIGDTCKLPIGLNAEIPIGEITKPLTQTFTGECNDIRSLDIFFDTYGRKNSGTLNVSLSDEISNALVFEEDIDIASLQDNEWKSFEFPIIQNASGKKFALTLSPLGSTPGNAVTVWSTESDIYTQGELIGVEINGDLAFRYFCQYGMLSDIRKFLNK